MKLTGDITIDHGYLSLEAIADSAIESAVHEVSMRLSHEEGDRVYNLRSVLSESLIKMAKDHYKAQVDLKTGQMKKTSSFKGNEDGSKLRDWHHTFMRHWVAGELTKNHGVKLKYLVTTANGESFK